MGENIVHHATGVVERGWKEKKAWNIPIANGLFWSSMLFDS